MKLPRAQDLMTVQVITVMPEMSAKDAWRILVENQVSGAPVVDGSGKLVGVLSLNDLARRAFTDNFNPSKASSFYEALPYDEGCGLLTEESPDRLTNSRVEQLMSPYVITVSPTDSAAAVAKVMRERRIHRVIVKDRDSVVGIISALDLLSLIA